MKIISLNKIFLLISLFLISIAFSNAANATCDKTGAAIQFTQDSATPVKDDGTAGDQCSDTPDAYKSKFYKLGLCTADTSSNDLSSCEYIINSSAGIEHIITYPTSGEISVPEFMINPGTYPYMVAVLSNKLGIKHSITTTTNVTGASGTGKFCWTSDAGPSAYTNEAVATPHGTTIAGDGSDVLIECGTSAGTAIFSYEVINILSQEACSDGFDPANGDSQAMGSVGNGTATVGLLQADDSFGTSCANASKILWTTALTTPQVITVDSSYELKLRTQNAVSVDFDNNEETNAVVKMGADPIQLYLTVTD